VSPHEGSLPGADDIPDPVDPDDDSTLFPPPTEDPSWSFPAKRQPGVHANLEQRPDEDVDDEDTPTPTDDAIADDTQRQPQGGADGDPKQADSSADAAGISIADTSG